MKSRNVLLSVLLLCTASLARNLPSNTPTQAPSSDIEPTFTPIPSATPGADSALVCGPSVKTTTIANVRNGPGQIYAVIGSLPLGGTAPVAGKSADGAWWYIEFAAGEAGDAWIAGIVTTASCIPETLAIIVAPPAPVAAATSAPSSSDPVSEGDDSPPESSEGSMPAATPTSPFLIYLLPPILPTVDIKIDNIKNLGNYLILYISFDAPEVVTSMYEYKVWVNGTLVMTYSIPLARGLWTYTLPGYDPPPGEFTVYAKLDTANVIAEYDETNNEMSRTCPETVGVFCHE